MESTQRKLVTRRLLGLFITLLVLTILVAYIGLYRIAASLDDHESGDSYFHVQAALTSLEQFERTYIQSFAFWEDGYTHLNDSIDPAWAYNLNNIGPTLFSTDGYEGVFVIDDSSTPYAMVDGKLVDQPLARFSPTKHRILEQARTAAQAQQATSGYLRFRGEPAQYVAAVIRPPASDPNVVPPKRVLVFIRVLTQDKLQDLARNVGLGGFALRDVALAAPGRNFLPLDGSDAWLTWEVPRPGRQLIWSVVPPLLIGTLVIVLLTVVGVRYAVRFSAQMEHNFKTLAKTNQALESSEERFRAVAEAASDWIWETDAQLQLTYLSERFSEITGYPLASWLGRPLTELLECDTSHLHTWLIQLAADNTGASLQCHYRDHLDQVRICRIAARPILDGDRREGFRGTSSDITDEVAAHAQIQHLSLHDALTGLPNRNQLFRFLERIPLDRSVAVLMLDLDHFKPINDNLGHPAGDAVLIEMAARLRQVTRERDLVARLGDDEFVLVLPDPGKREDLDRLCARVIASLGEPVSWEGHALRLEASLGLALSEEHGHLSVDLLKYADVAMYSAKQAGRNTWRYFSAELNASIVGKHQLEQELRAGIAAGQLVLHYQPRFKVDGRTVASAEALVRWKHPQKGLLRPDSFIPMAEQSELIVLLGNWVLHEACASARNWPMDLTVSVNLSPAQFSRSDVVAEVRQALIDTGLPAHRLELEVTENVMLNDVEGALHTLNALKELGVRLNMDDFGTGYSSLGYLRTYPFDGIKIDKRFVQALGKSQRDRSVVQAIINLGNAMGMTVTAEGVETAEQLSLLDADRCHEVQGYLLSRPIDNDALVQLLARARLGRKVSA